MLFENTIERNGPENIVQVVTDNASENVPTHLLDSMCRSLHQLDIW